jgi:hypothetical protein
MANRRGFNIKQLTKEEARISKLIDNIDTASDLAKNNYALYHNLVTREILKYRGRYIFAKGSYQVIDPDNRLQVLTDSSTLAYKLLLILNRVEELQKPQLVFIDSGAVDTYRRGVQYQLGKFKELVYSDGYNFYVYNTFEEEV